MDKNFAQKLLIFTSFIIVMTAFFVLALKRPIEKELHSKVRQALRPYKHNFLVEVEGRDVNIQGKINKVEPSTIIKKLLKIEGINKLSYNLHFNPEKNKSIKKRSIASTNAKKVHKKYTYYFHYKSSKLKEKSLRELEELKQKISKIQSKSFELQGFTDNIGPETYNFKLSKKRANAILNQLISMGADYRKIALYYKGKARAKQRYEQKEMNRRVDLIIYNHEAER